MPTPSARRFALAALLAAALVSLARCAPEPPPTVRPPREGFAFRDPRVGAPVAAGPRDDRLLDEGMAALAQGDLEGARKAFASGVRRAKAAPLFRLGGAYVDMAEGRFDAASAAVDTLVAQAHGWTAALEARADLAASRGLDRDALDSYRKAFKTLPGDERLARRVAEVQGKLADGLAEEAAAALESGDLEAARRAGFGLVELDPAGPRGFRTLSEAAARAEKWDDAYSFAERARALVPGDAAWTERTAELAARSGRHGEAAALWESLADEDASAAGKADAERLAFRVQNLPASARLAARSPKLTRAQAAALAYWLVPEVREAPTPATTEVATDVVDRPDRAEIVRAINLGLLSVSETHHVGPDAVLSRGELAAFLRRLAALVAQGRKLPECLAGDAGPGALAECGILPESSGRGTSGKEAMGAVERAARAGREGARR